MAKPPRILLVDDHPLTRAGTASVLRGVLPGAGFGEAASLASARHLVEEESWDLVLLDMNLPDGHAMDSLAWFATRARVLVFTMYSSRELCLEARRSGARGFLTKGDPPSEVVRAVQRILGRGEHFPLLDADGTGHRGLSEQENAVLRELLQGTRQIEIARRLSLSPTTVQSYKNRLMGKFEVTSVAELVRAATERGIH